MVLSSVGTLIVIEGNIYQKALVINGLTNQLNNALSHVIIYRCHQDSVYVKGPQCRDVERSLCRGV